MKPTDLANIIAKAIIKDGGLTLDEIETRCQAKGFDLDLVYEAMEHVRRKPRIVSQGNKFVLKPKPKPYALPKEWLKENYPRPHHCEHGIEYTGCDHCKPFPDIDLSWMFLKTKEERDQYHADAKNMPLYMVKSNHRKSREQNPTSHPEAPQS